ncbi:MAG TPA: DUF3579 domain-containing protein [Burkholderiaceae bacterium]|jgi:hypothetical protein|nr:DUF3579 domain-containing protein [Burkholderiaceae bacterium]
MPATASPEAPPGRFMIVGITASGRRFRPSDWAERLAGIMARFQPPGASRQSHLSYSPYVVPAMHEGVKCVIVDPRLREIEPLALSFLLNFARDNELQVQPARTENSS